MSNAVFLTIMLGIIGLVGVLSLASLFFKRCPKCRARNGLDARVCRKCGNTFPVEG